MSLQPSGSTLRLLRRAGIGLFAAAVAFSSVELSQSAEASLVASPEAVAATGGELLSHDSSERTQLAGRGQGRGRGRGRNRRGRGIDDSPSRDDSTGRRGRGSDDINDAPDDSDGRRGRGSDDVNDAPDDSDGRRRS